jgi:hypothetical protein
VDVGPCLDPDAVLPADLGEVGVVLRHAVPEREVVQPAPAAGGVFHDRQLVAERVHAHPGAHFHRSIDDGLAGAESERLLEERLLLGDV